MSLIQLISFLVCGESDRCQVQYLYDDTLCKGIDLEIPFLEDSQSVRGLFAIPSFIRTNLSFPDVTTCPNSTLYLLDENATTIVGTYPFSIQDDGICSTDVSPNTENYQRSLGVLVIDSGVDANSTVFIQKMNAEGLQKWNVV
jgi:hypothetical protein